ncbi:MAG: transcriptional regulator TbsP [Halolamina sp.]
MVSNLLEHEIDDILRTKLSETNDTLLVVDPSANAIKSLVDIATTFDGETPTINLLADNGTLKDVMEDFLVASSAANLVGDGVLAVRNLETDVDNSLLVTDDAVHAVVRAEEAVAALGTDDEGFVEGAVTTYEELFAAADPFNLRTPAIDEVRETLDEEIGDATREDFDHVLASLETARGDGEGLDEVTISLLVAAKNDELLYDISKWGEDVGIASKATFSRTKTQLEEMELIDTEKVPIDVGRPRLRLKLGDDRLKQADSNQLASIAQSMLN